MPKTKIGKVSKVVSNAAKQKSGGKKRAEKEIYRKKSAKSYLSHEETKFASYLESLGFRIQHVEGDGNCMFRAVADQLEGDSLQHAKYRQKCVDHIEQHKDHFGMFIEDDEDFIHYTSRLRTAGEWGGYQELVAVSQCCAVSVVVHQLDAPRYVIPNDRTTRVIHLSYHGECHYNSVHPIRTSVAEEDTRRHCAPRAKLDKPRTKQQQVAFDALSRAFPMLTDEEVTAALQLHQDSVDDAIDFVCTNLDQLQLAVKNDSRPQNLATHDSNRHDIDESIERCHSAGNDHTDTVIKNEVTFKDRKIVRDVSTSSSTISVADNKIAILSDAAVLNIFTVGATRVEPNRYSNTKRAKGSEADALVQAKLAELTAGRARSMSKKVGSVPK